MTVSNLRYPNWRCFPKITGGMKYILSPKKGRCETSSQVGFCILNWLEDIASFKVGHYQLQFRVITPLIGVILTPVTHWFLTIYTESTTPFITIGSGPTLFFWCLWVDFFGPWSGFRLLGRKFLKKSLPTALEDGGRPCRVLDPRLLGPLKFGNFIFNCSHKRLEALVSWTNKTKNIEVNVGKDSNIWSIRVMFMSWEDWRNKKTRCSRIKLRLLHIHRWVWRYVLRMLFLFDLGISIPPG